MSILDEHDTAPIWWEPWTPKVGDRVRVRLSGECRLPIWPKAWGAERGFKWLHEDPGLISGRTGVVTDLFEFYRNYPREEVQEALDYYTLLGHPYDVVFDDPIAGEWGDNRGGMFAAAELEPLDPES